MSDQLGEQMLRQQLGSQCVFVCVHDRENDTRFYNEMKLGLMEAVMETRDSACVVLVQREICWSFYNSNKYLF